MPSDAYVLAALLVAFVVTVALRALPFVVIGAVRDSPAIRFLGVHMPAGVMVILAIYTVRVVPLSPWPHGLPEAIGIAATVGLHLWRRNAVVSIIGGTVAYVVLLGWVFG